MKNERECEGCGTKFSYKWHSWACSDKCRVKYTRARSLMYQYQIKDMARGWPSDLNLHYMYDRLEGGKCVYCEEPNNLGLDRIDNKQGHTRENTIVSCSRCNRFRGDYLTVEETKKVVKYIRTFKKW